MQWEAPFKPLAVDNLLPLPERDMHAEIDINWFLDRETPKGGHVRILAESLLWEERDNVVYWKTTGKINNDLHCGKNTLVKQEYELQRASLHACSRTEGGQLRAAFGILNDSDG